MRKEFAPEHPPRALIGKSASFGGARSTDDNYWSSGVDCIAAGGSDLACVDVG